MSGVRTAEVVREYRSKFNDPPMRWATGFVSLFNGTLVKVHILVDLSYWGPPSFRSGVSHLSTLSGTR